MSNQNNSGALFKNNRKEKDTHPDYTGSVNIEGVDYFMDAWLNTSASGLKYFGMKFKRKDQQGGVRSTAAPAAAPAAAPGATDLSSFGDLTPPAVAPPAAHNPTDDDIPF